MERNLVDTLRYVLGGKKETRVRLGNFQESIKTFYKKADIVEPKKLTPYILDFLSITNFRTAHEFLKKEKDRIDNSPDKRTEQTATVNYNITVDIFDRSVRSFNRKLSRLDDRRQRLELWSQELRNKVKVDADGAKVRKYALKDEAEVIKTGSLKMSQDLNFDFNKSVDRRLRERIKRDLGVTIK